MNGYFLIRATHQYGFRSGEWAQVEGIVWMNGRPCWKLRFLDGALDQWPVYDASDPYEFKPMVAGPAAFGPGPSEYLTYADKAR